MTDPAGFKTFADDVVLTASEINGYLMQGILVFADSAARDTALSGSLAEGRFCYLKSNNTTYYYSGSGWVAVGSAAATISGTTGSPATSSITGYALTKWTGNGSVTIGTAGLVTVLVAAGGGGGNSSRAGGAGGYISRTIYLPAGTYTITVGAGGSLTTFGGDSRLDNIVAFGGGNNVSTARVNWGGSAPGGGYSTNIPGQGNASTGTWGGGGAGGSNSGNTGGVGVAWLDGVTYCAGGSEPGAAGAANTGNGGGGGNYSGGSGIVIIAQAV